MEVIALTKWAWEDLYHRSSFLPNKEGVETQLQNPTDYVNTV